MFLFNSLNSSFANFMSSNNRPAKPSFLKTFSAASSKPTSVLSFESYNFHDTIRYHTNTFFNNVVLHVPLPSPHDQRLLPRHTAREELRTKITSSLPRTNFPSCCNSRRDQRRDTQAATQPQPEQRGQQQAPVLETGPRPLWQG
jgi:hypothetical protein